MIDDFIFVMLIVMSSADLLDTFSKDSLLGVITHSIVAYLPLFFRVLAWLAFFLSVYASIVRWYENVPRWIDWVFASMGMLLFLWYLLRLYQIRLDAIVLLPNGLQRLVWNNLFRYDSTIYERESIVSVSHQKKGVIDSLFFTGTLVIMMEDGREIVYPHVYDPQSVVQKITNEKTAYDARKFQSKPSEQPATTTSEDFQVFVSTLGNVIRDYLQKKS